MSVESTPKWYMPVSILALVWNLIGVMAFFDEISKSPEVMAALPPAERALYDNQPLWAVIAFAVAVFAGLIGSLGLVMKKRWALPTLILSIAALLIQMFHSLVIAQIADVYGPNSLLMPILLIVIAFMLVRVARVATNKGWLH